MESMDIDYNKLKSFLAVVHSGSVTGAAKDLNRTQSAVSQAIRSLEQNLGVTLIEWEGKRLKLTREGQLIHKATHSRMAAIEEQLESIIKSGEEVSGCIEIGILQDHSTRIQEQFIQSITAFRKKYPAVTFNVTFGTSREIEQGLLNQILDIGLLINFQERHRFEVFQVGTETHLVVASSKYLKKIGSIKHFKDIIQADLIDITENFTCLTPWIQKHAPSLVQALDERTPVIVIPDFRAVKELILLDQGIGVIPNYLIEKELANGKVVQIMPKLTGLRVGIDCATLKGKKERLSENLFIEALYHFERDTA